MKDLTRVLTTSARTGSFVGRTRAQEDAYYETFRDPLFPSMDLLRGALKRLRRISRLDLQRSSKAPLHS